MKARLLLLLTCAFAIGFVPAGYAAKHSKHKADIRVAFLDSCSIDPTRFAERACYLKTDVVPGFVPGNLFSGGDPKCGSRQLNQEQINTLAKAYRLAPEHIKQKLCNVKRLFLTEDDYGSWGLWEARDSAEHNPEHGGTETNRLFIAISDKALSESLNTLHANILAKLLNTNELTAIARFEGAGTDDPAWAALALLAHELGHILVGVSDADGFDPRHPRRKPEVGSGEPPSQCFDTVILAKYWQRNLFLSEMKRFVGFGEQNPNRQKNIQFILDELRGHPVEANNALRALYRSKEFPSGVAAVSPVEHLVVTFEFKVLADALPESGMQRLSIKLPTQTTSMTLNQFLSAKTLSPQVDCLRALGMIPMIRSRH